MNKCVYHSYYIQHGVQHDFLIYKEVEGKGFRAIPIWGWTRSEGSRRLRIPEFLDNRRMMVGRLSALGTGGRYSQMSLVRISVRD